MSVTDPTSLHDVLVVADPAERAIAAKNYLTLLDSLRDQAIEIRDDAIGAMLDAGAGVTATANRVGMSVSHVKGVRRAPKDGPYPEGEPDAR